MATRLVNAAQDSLVPVLRGAKEARQYIQIRNLPRTALPTDVYRLCAKANTENVAKVGLDYNRFLSTGKAILTLSSPVGLYHNLEVLKGHIVGGHLITARAWSPKDELFPRTRGAKGKEEAVERGIVEGNGLDGGVHCNGRGVVLWGLPGTQSAEATRNFLKKFKLAGIEAGQAPVHKLEPRGGRNGVRTTGVSRHFIRLATVSEAHRVVRLLHRTYFESDVWGTRYPLRASVVY